MDPQVLDTLKDLVKDKKLRNVAGMKLKCKLKPIPSGSEEWKFVHKLCKSSHSPDHDVQWELEKVFEVERREEAARDWEGMDKRTLLFHGSPKKNVLNILENGLQIAPEGVALVGAMFGPGVYFADSFSVSLYYSKDRESLGGNSETAYLLLCSVRLGRIFPLLMPAEALNLGGNLFDSVKAVGEVAPQDGVVFHHSKGFDALMGEMKKEPDERELGVDVCVKNNEYVIFDTSRIKIEYLLQINIKNSKNFNL